MKKFLAILLCLVLVVSLAACGNNEEELKARYDEGYKAGYSEGEAAGKTEGEKAGSEAGYKTGYEEGKKAGYDEGAKAGNEESYQAGYDEGVTAGKAEGYAAGKDEGYSTGKDEGYKAGVEEGKKAGYDEGYAAGKEDGIKEGKSSGSSAQKYARFSGSFTASVMKLSEDGYALPGNTVAVVHFFQDGPFLLRFYEDVTGKLAEGKAYVFEFRPFEVLIPGDVSYPDIKDYATHIEISGYRAARDDETGMQSNLPTVETFTK